MNKLFAIALFLIATALCAQERQLRGKAISDVLKVEGLNVANTTLNLSTVTGSEGDFTITARINDVLEFSGPVFKTMIVVLRAADFAEEIFVVRLEPFATMLDEVVVTGLTGNLAADSKKLKTPQINTWFDAAEINKDVVVQTGIGGANWIAGIAGLFKKPTPPKRATTYVMADVAEEKLFSQVVKESYPASFFIETLKIPARFTGAFLTFCDEDAKRYLLMLENEPELIEYLKGKSAEFLRLNPDAR